VNPLFSAYVDESMLVARGLYLMAAVLVAPHQADRYRADLRGLLFRRQPRLHWRDEEHKRRCQVIEAVAALRPAGIVVVGTGMDSKRQERARRKCMEHLLWELGHRAVVEVCFESRNRVLDAADKKLIDILRIRNAISPRLRAVWLPAVEEPLIWLPDIVAGAASLATHGDPGFWETLGSGVEMSFVTLG
jgi:hypothetical protein